MNDEQYMRLALSLAKKGHGTTSPNPMVGAVLVKNDRIVGKGYHKKVGLPHAEVMAIHDAGEEARDSTLYINLEPCVHFGRTPPCTEAIKEAGIKKVVMAMLDPNPQVSGRGIQILRDAGTIVKTGVLEEEARRLNEAFITYMEKSRPFFIMKAAISLDGKIATKTCDSKWISNEESRRFTNRLRADMDAIMVGINTVITDNPMLIPKMVKIKKYPLRIILDSKLRLPLASEIAKTSDKFKTIVFTSEDSRADKEARLKSLGLDVIRSPKDENGRVSLRYVCDELYKKDIMSVLIEGGGEINSGLLREGLIDKFILFYAPIFIGGKNALNLIGGKGVDFLKDAYRLKITQIRRFKDDLCLEGYVHRDY
ncbi:MAG: bifunctional diaminohydroxyphosphoribosylaminopyrimidine deaminase/5-amino-6-(5-phosphoribosylamino)uracil reductase RibD [Syntrophorhabdales bacterium]|nr:bifunctional diaminohydroxyphosphoribosylaminopyrimidine deaminase/5-amino-6-(5-phosphoribosylamino)uracil reductase RibD [Syntrophorhabdales bacterium]